MSYELRSSDDGDKTFLALNLNDNADVTIKSDPAATAIQVGKILMIVGMTHVRLVSREGPATGHSQVHEVELWSGPIPS